MAINFALASGNSFPVCTYIRGRDHFGLRPATEQKLRRRLHQLFHPGMSFIPVSGHLPLNVHMIWSKNLFAPG